MFEALPQPTGYAAYESIPPSATAFSIRGESARSSVRGMRFSKMLAVPFGAADRRGAVVAGQQDQRVVERPDLAPGREEVGLRALEARIAWARMGQPAAAHRVLVLAGEQRGKRRRAHRHGGVAGEAQPADGQRVDVRRADLAAVAAEVREADVVEQDHDHVGRALARGPARRPPRRGLGEPAADPALSAGAGIAVQPRTGRCRSVIARRVSGGAG